MNNSDVASNVLRRDLDGEATSARRVNSRSMVEQEHQQHHPEAGRSPMAFIDGSSFRRQPPTPPGSPVDRPFPAAMLPPPPAAVAAVAAAAAGAGGGAHGGKDGRGPRRRNGDGAGRHAKPGVSKSVAAHQQGSRRTDTSSELPARQPSDGYQALDELNHDNSSVGSEDCSQNIQQPGFSASSDSDDSSSECDWSEEAADSSEGNSDDEVKPPRAAADGMSSDTETECLL
jgi:hypothetical protein